MKTEKNLTKEQAIELVENSYPTIWAKEDVLKLLNRIEDNEDISRVDKDDIFQAVEECFEDFKSACKSAINGMSADEVVDYDSAEFELDGNTISVSSIDLSDSLTDSFDGDFDDFIDAVKEKINNLISEK